MTFNIYHPVDPDDGLSTGEVQLASLINDDRLANGLPAVPLSASLTLVAERHVEDIVYNLGGYQQGTPGSDSAHGWSDDPYDASNPSTYPAIWTAPQRLGTSYPGHGYEILTGYVAPVTATTVMTPLQALSGWQGSPPHNAIILNQGSWSMSSLTWNAMGVAILDGVASVWFGHEADPAGTPVTDTGAVTATSAGMRRISVHGPHNGYTVAQDPSSGMTEVQDAVAGRDGTAMQAGIGTVIFSDGVGKMDPSGNLEEAARLYRAALGRSPDPAGLDNVTAPIDAGTLMITDVAACFIGSSEFTSHYGALSNPAFVQQLYQNVLGRAGSGSEVQAWADRLAAGASRASVLVGFSDSYENKVNTLSYSGDRDYGESYRLYQAAFDRTPDTFGQRGFTTQLDKGVPLISVAQQVIGSAEFAAKYSGLDAAGFVGQLYQNVLHRAGSVAEVGGWVGQLDAGASRASVLLGFSDSLENRANTAASTHDNWVFIPS